MFDYAVSREAIAWCYRLFLGREPASQEIADSHLNRPSFEHLRGFFATHPEFKVFLENFVSDAPKVPAAPATVGRAERFDYVVDKIEAAPYTIEPFRHLYIENLFSDDDFAELIGAQEIHAPPADSDKALIDDLMRRNYKAIPFPGTTTDLQAYLDWHADPTAARHKNQETCEGYGVVMRLQKVTPGSILADAEALFTSDRFWNVAAAKFGLTGTDLRRDHGLQKYLDGYEISPHCDIRMKALTFMINVNPALDSEDIPFHTQYMTFRPERDYVRMFWSGDSSVDRVWVPWDWCETKRIQTKNNSIVLFSPGNDTLHAIKASYNHLRTQRTQFYGNLWYPTKNTTRSPSFRALDEMAPVMAPV